MKRYTLLGLLLLFTFHLQAQQKYTVSGYVREAGSRELLPGVNIYIPALKSGTVTNNYGFYSITLPEDSYEIRFSYVGFETHEARVELTANTELNVALSANLVLSEVVISSEQSERVSETSRISNVTIPVRQIRNIPALLGEKDVFKVLQLMPGVQKGTEGSSGVYVRGGGPDQNLIILDDAAVYNASHLFGFFSIFNGDALKSVALIKGGFPARYGGRLSSVIEMTMKDGNKTKIGGEAGIGLISSRLMLEGPIKKEKVSFLVSGRRTYLDALLRPFMKDSETSGSGGYYFYDFNAKLNYDISPKNKLYLSGYFGRDKFFMNDRYGNGGREEGGLFWENNTTTLRWNHLYSPKLFSNTSAIFSRYNLQIFNEDRDRQGTNFLLRYNSGIRDLVLKHDLEYNFSPAYTIRTGLQAMQHEFIPSAYVMTNNMAGISLKNRKQYMSYENGVYVENNLNLHNRWLINAGLRLSHFHVEDKDYLRPEPRLSVNYILNEGQSVKLAWSQMNQYIHLLSNTGIGMPTDLWVPSTARVLPQHSNQVAAGYARDLEKQNLALTVEGYYKWSDNIIGYKPGASFLLLDDPSEAQNFTWEDNITSGKGRSYGVELLLQRKTGRLNGWVGYTLAWSKQQFDEINHGKEFFARHDRRHDLSVVGIYELKKNITLSGTWVFGSGAPVTLPVGRFDVLPFYLFEKNMQPGKWYPRTYTDYGEVNSYRMASYHRLDLGVQFHKQKKKYERTWEVGLYNAYSRKNPFFYFIDSEYNESGGQYKLKQTSLFPIIPSVSYNIKF